MIRKNITRHFMLMSAFLSTSCSQLYVSPALNNNAQVEFVDIKSVKTVYADGHECRDPSYSLPSSKIIIKANREFAMELYSRGKGRYYCENLVSFVPKPNSYYIVDQHLNESDLTCYFEIREKVQYKGGIYYERVPLNYKKFNQPFLPFINRNGPWCKPSG